jgi:hypothetical protein
MSPSLVRERSSLIEFYLREIVKNPNLTRMPFVREFLKIPMNKAELDELEEEFGATSKCSAECECRCEFISSLCVVSCSRRLFKLASRDGPQ